MAPKTKESNINFVRDYFNFPRTYSRKDICIAFGYRTSTSLEEIFRRKNLVYKKHPEMCTGHFPPKTYYLVDVFNNSFIEFLSGRYLLKEAILSDGVGEILNEYLREKYLVLYRGRNYVVCDRLDQPIRVSLQNPYDILRIRQKMRDLGYNVSCTTTLNEICRMLNISRSRKSVKREICEFLEIEYSPQISPRGGIRKPVYFRKLSTGETQSFDNRLVFLSL